MIKHFSLIYMTGGALIGPFKGKLHRERRVFWPIFWGIILVFLIGSCQRLHANVFSKTTKETTSKRSSVLEYLKKITPEFLYAYTDFNFNSSMGDNFNRYKGHSNLYSTGADHISLGSTMMLGLYYFRIDTTVNSQLLITPGDITFSEQTIRNNTLFGHILKIFHTNFFADLGGGYGYNKLTTFSQIAIPLEPLVAQANNTNNNWFISFNAIYRKSWKKFLIRTNLGGLYSEIDSGRYEYIFPVSNTSLLIQPLINKSTLILENAELSYFVTPKFMPFINGGLIQVAQFSNSRPLLNPSSVINGSLPQLNMNKDGFRLGAGVVYTYKKITLRLEEKYYNAGGTFKSYQTLAALEYQFN